MNHQGGFMKLNKLTAQQIAVLAQSKLEELAKIPGMEGLCIIGRFNLGDDKGLNINFGAGSKDVMINRCRMFVKSEEQKELDIQRKLEG